MQQPVSFERLIMGGFLRKVGAPVLKPTLCDFLLVPCYFIVINLLPLHLLNDKSDVVQLSAFG